MNQRQMIMNLDFRFKELASNTMFLSYANENGVAAC
jgi:hypothetical protein